MAIANDRRLAGEYLLMGACALIGHADPGSLNADLLSGLRDALDEYALRSRPQVAPPPCRHPSTARTYLGGAAFDETRVLARYSCRDCGATTETLLPKDSEAAHVALYRTGSGGDGA